ncbi:hypothetical protein [Lacrimispora sp.]|uniref:hypothetical protein n=1 Tax=Lacrimispora sp. TaxID=2719234 RepID=UPI0029E74B62|nr:hypothetical protein [Lacrimispora sp.]
MSPEDAKEWGVLLNISIPVIVGLTVFFLCLANLDNLYKLLGSFQKLFSYCSKSARKGAVSNSIKGRVLKASKIVKSLDNDVMLKDLKIEWVKHENIDSFINNKQVILRLEHNANPHKNFVTAVSAFVDVGLLPKAKRYVKSEIVEASNLIITRDIILKGDSEALDYYDDNILKPAMESKIELKDLYAQLKMIDGNGMMYQILLNEYSKSARELYPDPIGDPCFTAETSELLRFLCNIAQGNVTDLEEFRFNREYFKIHIFLTANSRTYNRSGIKVYIKPILQSIDQGTKTLYLFGLGRKVSIAKEIVDEVTSQDFRVGKVVRHQYKHKNNSVGRRINGVCYELRIEDI